MKPALLWLLPIVGVILLMVAAGAAGLQADSIWHDEFVSLYFAGWAQDRSDPLAVVERVAQSPEEKMIVYPALLGAWSSVAGWSVFSARTLSLLIGVLAVGWAYRAGRDLHSNWAGFCACVILGGSALFFVYLHEIRTYTLWALLALVVIWLYWRGIQRRASRRRLLAFMAASTAVLYAHPLSFAFIGALGLYHLLLARREGGWLGWLAALILTGLLYAPWALTIASVASTFGGGGSVASLASDGLWLLRDLAHGFSNGLWFFLALPLASLKQIRQRPATQLLCCIFTAYLAAMLVANHQTERISHVRYLMPLLPVFALLAGMGCAAFAGRRRFLAAVLVCWQLAGLGMAQSFRTLFYSPGESAAFHLSSPFAEFIPALRRDATEADAVVFDYPHHVWAVQGAIDFYMEGSRARYILTENLGAPANPEATLAQFKHFLGAAGRVYFAVDKSTPPSALLPEYERLLAGRYIHCERLWSSAEARADKYARVQDLCQPPDQALVEYAAPLKLLDFARERTHEGHFFYSTWSADLPAGKYSLSLRLWDPAGELLHLVDGALPTGDFNYRIDHLPLEALPAAESFRAEVVVYDWRTGERLRTADGADSVIALTFEA